MFLACSPNIINAQLREKVMGINENMIAKEKMLWFFNQILPTNSVRKCIEISLENLYANIGAWTIVYKYCVFAFVQGCQ